MDSADRPSYLIAVTDQVATTRRLDFGSLCGPVETDSEARLREAAARFDSSACTAASAGFPDFAAHLRRPAAELRADADQASPR